MDPDDISEPSGARAPSTDSLIGPDRRIWDYRGVDGASADSVVDVADLHAGPAPRMQLRAAPEGDP